MGEDVGEGEGEDVGEGEGEDGGEGEGEELRSPSRHEQMLGQRGQVGFISSHACIACKDMHASLHASLYLRACICMRACMYAPGTARAGRSSEGEHPSSERIYGGA